MTEEERTKQLGDEAIDWLQRAFGSALIIILIFACVVCHHLASQGVGQ